MTSCGFLPFRSMPRPRNLSPFSTELPWLEGCPVRSWRVVIMPKYRAKNCAVFGIMVSLQSSAIATSHRFRMAREALARAQPASAPPAQSRTFSSRVVEPVASARFFSFFDVDLEDTPVMKPVSTRSSKALTPTGSARLATFRVVTRPLPP